MVRADFLFIYPHHTVLIQVEPPAAGAGGSLKQRDLPRVTALYSPGWSRGIPSRGIKKLFENLYLS
jgi:hypothetical protein